MHTVLLIITLAVFGLVLALTIGWLAPFSLLFWRIRRRHPRYYAKLGRPYKKAVDSDIELRNDAARPKRHLAWWRGLSGIYAGVPRNFLRDKTAQRLAALSRPALRMFVPVIAVLILLCLPVDTFAYVLNRQSAVRITSIDPTSRQSGSKPHAKLDPTKHTSSTITSAADESARAAIAARDATSKVVVPTAATPTLVQLAQPPTPHGSVPLNRSDLSSAFTSIAATGQQRDRKRDVCQQLTTHYPVEDNLGPTGAICTDTNLLTYSTY